MAALEVLGALEALALYKSLVKAKQEKTNALVLQSHQQSQEDEINVRTGGVGGVCGATPAKSAMEMIRIHFISD